MKFCRKCQELKPESLFSKNRGTKDGLRSDCKACQSEYHKRYRPLHRTEHANSNRAYGKTPAGKLAQRKKDKNKREKYPEKIKANSAVNNAVKAGQITRPSICESCLEEGLIDGHHEDYSK
ncbi:hypothetical protein LCGC14_2824300, partial [marine sediment metagenome]